MHLIIHIFLLPNIKALRNHFFKVFFHYIEKREITLYLFMEFVMNQLIYKLLSFLLLKIYLKIV